MKRVCLVGLGVITKHYLRGLENSKQLQLVAVCDCNENALARPLYGDYPFYTDHKVMIEEEKPDLLLIATPPATHYGIAEYALLHGVGVILEKPATLTLSDLEKLLSLADREGVFFTTMFHWQTGEEILRFKERFSCEDISSIEVCINDHYSTDGLSIKEDRVPLGGAWVDSGVNALSMINTLVPFDTYQIVDVSVQKCTKSGLPIFARVQLDIALGDKHVAVVISIDWRKENSAKYSLLKTAEGREILIEHTEQKIVAEGGAILLDDMPRLQRHYYNYFTRFNSTSSGDALKIHQLLFEVDKRI